MQNITENTILIETFTTEHPKKVFNIAEGISFDYLIILEDNAQIDFDIHCQ
jgi:hypothetical protein